MSFSKFAFAVSGAQIEWLHDTHLRVEEKDMLTNAHSKKNCLC